MNRFKWWLLRKTIRILGRNVNGVDSSPTEFVLHIGWGDK